MRILIDIGHPADMLLFKEFALHMISKGSEILFTVRDKDVTINLLNHYNFNYKSFGKHFKTLWGKILGILKFDIHLLFVTIKYKPSMFLSTGSIYASHVSFCVRKPHIVFEDTGNMEQVKLYRAFTAAILTSTSFPKKISNNQLTYDSYHELAYLHPNYFKPDCKIIEPLKLGYEEKFIIIRFVSWEASHDVGQKGIPLDLKYEMVKELSKKAKVYISSEAELPEDLRRYKFQLSPNDIHHALAYAHLYIGEGATMASESAILGTPAIYINSQSVGYCDELEEKYGLVYNFKNSNGAIERAIQLLENPELKKEALKKMTQVIKDKIDLTAFMVWFIENWPQSFKIMKKKPDYQYNFK